MADAERIAGVVNRKISKAMMTRKISKAMLTNAIEHLAFNPNAKIPRAGMSACFVATIKHHWPDTDERTAYKWASEYIDFDGELTPSAAKALALDFMSEYGDR